MFLWGAAGRRVVLRFNGRRMVASRAVWMLAHGDPGAAFVLHTCNGGSGAHGCINIQHLRLGTRLENSQDCVAAGHLRTPIPARGADNPGAVLDVAQVLSIREKHAGGVSQRALVREYGVSTATVSRIVRRLSWGWLN
jgi:hypothetical protein